MKPHPDPTQVLKDFILGERDACDPLIEEYSRTQPGFAEEVQAFLEDEDRIHEAGKFRVVPAATEKEKLQGVELVRNLVDSVPPAADSHSNEIDETGPSPPGSNSIAPKGSTKAFWFRIAAALLVSASLVALLLQRNTDDEGFDDVAVDEEAVDGEIDTSDFMLGPDQENEETSSDLAPKGSIVSDMPSELSGPLEFLQAKTDGTEAPGDDFVFQLFAVDETQPLITSRPQREANWTLGGLDRRRLGDRTQIEWNVIWTSSVDGQTRISTRHRIAFTTQ